MHLIDQIEKASSDFPQSVAIRSGRREITFRALGSTITAVAQQVNHMGFRPGDRFLYAARPTPESIAVTLGLLRAGLTLVLVDPFSAPHLFAQRAKAVNPRVVLADSAIYLLGHRLLSPLRELKKLSLAKYAEVVGAQHFYFGARLPGLPKSAKPAGALQNNSASGVLLPPIDPERDAIITFTSGTVGEPKGVVHSIATLSANADNFAQIFGIRPGQLIYAEPMTIGVVAMANGATWQIPTKGEQLPSVIDLMFAVPTELRKLVKLIDKSSQAPKVHRVGTGAAPVRPKLVDEIVERLGPSTEIISVYGMTEMLPVATCDAKRKAAWLEGDLLGSPIGDTEIRLAEDGEITVRGSGLMKTYFGKPAAEWHPTGDLGRLVEGELVLLGRKKNMLIRGNKNIYPSLYEPSLAKRPDVADVAIVGVPDEIGDDQVVLIVEFEKTVADTQSAMQSLRGEMHKYFDGDALPDLVIEVAQMPVSGRALKRDQAALVRIAEAALVERGS